MGLRNGNGPCPNLESKLMYILGVFLILLNIFLCLYELTRIWLIDLLTRLIENKVGLRREIQRLRITPVKTVSQV